MESFTCLATGLDIHPIHESLALNEDAWHISSARQQTIRSHRDTQSIFLRQAIRDTSNQHLPNREVHPSRPSDYAWRFPEAVLLCDALAEELRGELGRALIVRLPPGGQVLPHVDDGSYYAIRDRYHLAIASKPGGSILGTSREEVEMKPGELWWLPNKQRHWARNLSATDRIHLIFDVLPHRREKNGNDTNTRTDPNGASPAIPHKENTT